jgi:hypothetical protein
MSSLDLGADAQAQFQSALALFGQGRYPEGVQLLDRAAHAGHVSAMSLLGAQLLSGRAVPADPLTGVRLILDAAERGGGYACAMAGALHASGIAGAPDWPRALDLVQRAAELGYTPAQTQLRLLAGGGGDDWGALRRAVDLEAWRTPPQPRLLCPDPLIRAYDKVLSPAVCDWIIANGRGRLSPAKVFNPSTGEPMRHEDRLHSTAEFIVADVDLVLLAARERLAAAAGLPAANLEGPQLLHYHVGERFTPHWDFLDAEQEGYARDIAFRGQRVATCLVYLNDDLEGGETDFPKLGLRHRGGKGDLLVFLNLDAQGQPDRRTLHAGLPPTRGEKWLLSQWVRDRSPPGAGDPRMTALMKGR